MSDTVVPLEVVEMEAFADLYRAASPEVSVAAGLSLQEIGGAVVIAAERADVLALNRVIGLGVREPASEVVVANVLSACARLESPRFFLPVAPIDHSSDLGLRLERLGARHYNNWMRLRRDLTQVPALDTTTLDVQRIGPAEAGVFGALVATAFNYPPSVAPVAAQAVGRPNWSHYLAYEAGQPIAAAAMYIAGATAWFGFAATAAERRGHGAQTALIVRRLRDGAEEGCRVASVETAEDTIEQNAPSFRNLRRLGFEVAYRRPNYLWTKSPS